MVNGFRYYRALESVNTASALSTALTIYPCQIRVHQRWQSKLQLPTARKKEWRPGYSAQFTHLRLPANTVIHTTLVGLEPATFRSSVRRATRDALSRCLHWLIAESMTVCCRSSHISTRRCFSSSTLHTRHLGLYTCCCTTPQIL